MEQIVEINQRELADLRTHIISAKSTKNYTGALGNFIFWIFLNCPAEICEELRTTLNTYKERYEEALSELSTQALGVSIRESEIIL